MKLSAQILKGVVETRSPLSYAAKVARSVTPGQSIHLASGEVFRVLSKVASVDGVRLRVAHRQGDTVITASQLAGMYPVSSGMRRVAAFVHSILAYDNTLSTYVNAAIEQAGYPTDPKMDWGKWLTSVYRPRLLHYTKDESLLDEAIREVVIHLLYERRLLETSFKPEHDKLEGKDLAAKVSAYLSFLFKKNTSDAVEYVQRLLGVGANGELGKQPVDSLYIQDEEGGTEDRNLDLQTGDQEDERLADQEMHSFLEAFKGWCSEHQRAASAEALNFISDLVEEGYTRKEMRDALVDSSLRGRDGQSYNNETFKVVMSNWARLIKGFAESSNSGFSATSLAKAIAARSAGNVKETDKVTASSLRLATDDTGKLPHAPYSSNTNTTTVIDPPKTNPNVQQQQNSTQNKGQAVNRAPNKGQPANPSPQEQQIQQGEDDTQQPQQRLTIPPEIPGVNHV